MSGALAMTIPWRKLGLSALVAAAFAFFWINGPLQEPQPVFEFEEHVTGFAEPVRMGQEYQTPITGMIPERERHAFYHIMEAKPAPQRLYGVIGDARTNPGLSEEVAQLVYNDARANAANPDGVTLKTALDMYYAEERDKDGRLVQLYMENTGLNKDVKGYAGPIDIGMTVGLDGKIRQVKYLRSMETTSYLRDVEKAGYYERFQSIPLDGKSYQVDLVSGASLTTEGVARSVTQLVSIARESPLGIYLDTEATGFDVKAVLPDTWVLQAGLIGLMFILTTLKLVRRSPKLSLGMAAVTVAYLGFYLNNSFTYVTFLQPFLGTSWSYILGAYAVYVILGAIWGGNTYCRHVCPYGNAQRLLVWLMPWKGKLFLSNRAIGFLRWAITITLAIGIAMGLRDWGSYELFPDLFGLEFMNSPWFWLSLALVLVSGYYPMLWCRALCPTGAVLDGVAWASRTRYRKTVDTKLAGIRVTTESVPA
ncbi:MAG: FMN-binding protein [Gammaproteobacteria bacterium]|nr:FMN-binding protein [Gammaproteobacteria bacterium]